MEARNLVFCLITADFFSAAITAGCLLFAAASPSLPVQDATDHSLSLLRVFAIVSAVAVSTWTIRSKLSQIDSREGNLSKDMEHIRKEVDEVKEMVKDLPCEANIRCAAEVERRVKEAVKEAVKNDRHQKDRPHNPES